MLLKAFTGLMMLIFITFSIYVLIHAAEEQQFMKACIEKGGEVIRNHYDKPICIKANVVIERM